MKKVRITIEVTPEQKQKIKSLAALEGLSVKNFLLMKALGIPKKELLGE